MTEKDYNRIVADRRDKEDFVVEDEDGGYLDDGEEHYFDRESGDEGEGGGQPEEAEAAEEPAGSTASKKRSRKHEKAAKGTKKVNQMFWEMRGSKANSASAIGPRGAKGGKKRKQPTTHSVAVEAIDLDAEFDSLDTAPARSVPARSAHRSAGRSRGRGSAGGASAAGASSKGSLLPRGLDDADAPSVMFEEVDDVPDSMDVVDDEEEKDAAPAKKVAAKSKLFKIAASRRRTTEEARSAEQSAVDLVAAEANNPNAAVPVDKDGKGWWNIGDEANQAAEALGRDAAQAAAAADGLSGAVSTEGLPLHEGTKAAKKTKGGAPAADGETKGEDAEEETYQYLKMFWLDIYEDPKSKGKIYVVGKVFDEETKQFVSCCVRVSGLERNLFFLPRQGSDGEEPAEIMNVYNEVSSILQSDVLRGQPFKCKPVARNYAFEIEGVPRKETTYLKVVYGAEYPALDEETTGQTFSKVFGTHTSGTENFILKRDLMGPCWIEVRAPCAHGGATGSNFSWCKLEATVDSPKQIVKMSNQPKPPPLVILSLALKTFVNQRTHAHEIVSASAVVHHALNADAKTPDHELARTTHFALVRGLGEGSGASLPLDFRNWAKAPERKSWLTVAGNERALLSCFLAKVHKCDPDFVVGHNLHGFGLDVLMSRLVHHKVAHWSKLGRIRRSNLPASKSGQSGRGAFEFFDMAPGRLLCDTYLTAKELVRENNYRLTHLAKVHLKKERSEIDPLDVPRYFQSSQNLVKLLSHTHQEAGLVFGLMAKLEMVPLTKQLTNLGGNKWSRTLKGGRAERIEYLLLHEFHRRKYIKPNKASKFTKSKGGKAAPQGKKKTSGGRGKPAYAGGLVLEPRKGLYDKYVLLLDFNSLYPSIIQEYNLCFTTVERQLSGGSIEDGPSSSSSSSSSSSVMGGMGGGGESGDPTEDFVMPPLPSEEAREVEGVLPMMIRILVQRRRQVKNMMKSEKVQAVKDQLDIRQLALKITANSMYGCLGFSGSRFYAKPIAALVTLQGREILQRTVDLATGMGLDVIYGDTDSIMIHTASDQLAKVYEIGNKVKRESNKLYKQLYLEIDGIYKTMLLLKKKKYAALVVNEGEKEGSPNFTYKETKGLDLVRRDWCQLSKDVGNYVLDCILSGKDSETVIGLIHTKLEEVAAEMRAGKVPMEKYIITKGLNKRPEQYPDIKGQAHLQVAMRMTAQKKPVNVGDHIPYVICAEQAPAKGADGEESKSGGKSSSGKGSFADRAYHPDEVTRSQNPNATIGDEVAKVDTATAAEALQVDIEWYLTQQILPPISRLCDPIDGTSHAAIAEQLGLEASKYNHVTYGANDDGDMVGLVPRCQMDDEDRFRGVQGLDVALPGSDEIIQFPGVFRVPEVRTPAKTKGGKAPAKTSTPSSVTATLGQEIAHAVKGEKGGAAAQKRLSRARLDNALSLSLRAHSKQYFDRWLVCEDGTCQNRTRQQSVRGRTCLNAACTGRVRDEYTDERLYTQVSIRGAHVMDTGGC